MLNRLEWRPIDGYKGLYEVSNFGDVRSLDRYRKNGKTTGYMHKGKVLKKSNTSTGYWKVELYKDGKRKSKKVHRLVAKAFIPEKKGYKIINHLDGDPLNNHVSNLEWCDQAKNVQHAYDIGLREAQFLKFEKEIVEEYVNNKNANMSDLARKYGCSKTTIQRYLKAHGVEIRGISQAQDIYKIDRAKMITYFNQGISNKQIAEKFKTNNQLIAVYRHLYKKGELRA